jgi:hypothetical protein
MSTGERIGPPQHVPAAASALTRRALQAGGATIAPALRLQGSVLVSPPRPHLTFVGAVAPRSRAGAGQSGGAPSRGTIITIQAARARRAARRRMGGLAGGPFDPLPPVVA